MTNQDAHSDSILRSVSPGVGPEAASPIEPPPRARLEAMVDSLLERGPQKRPSLPRAIPVLERPLDRPPSLLIVGEALSDAADQSLRSRGFRRIVDVEDLADALGALSERRYDAIAIWDHVHDKPVRFVRALLSFDGRADDPLLPLLSSRVRGVPVGVLHAVGGYAVFRDSSDWFLSEAGGPDWPLALQAAIVPPNPNDRLG